MTWQENAACKDKDSKPWFSDSPALIEVAQRICGTCEVQVECLEGALKRREQYGIWGGQNLGGKQKLRLKLRRQMLERLQAQRLLESA